jgi:hypothetical protein
VREKHVESDAGLTSTENALIVIHPFASCLLMAFFHILGEARALNLDTVCSRVDLLCSSSFSSACLRSYYDDTRPLGSTRRVNSLVPPSVHAPI